MFILENTVQCGGIEHIAYQLPNITSLVVKAIMIGVPVLLVIFGMIDLGKAVTAQKEDEIKKGQQMFFKRIITAAIVFFVIMIVSFMLSLIAPQDNGESKNIVECFNCFVNGPSSSEGQPNRHCRQRTK